MFYARSVKVYDLISLFYVLVRSLALWWPFAKSVIIAFCLDVLLEVDNLL